MGSLGLLIALDCIMILVVLILGFAAAFGAYYCTASPLYISDSKVKSAHKLLTWTAVIGIVLFAVILTVSIVIGVKGKHKDHFEVNTKNIALANKNLTKHHKTSWLVISLLIMNIAVFLSLGVVAVVSAIDLQGISGDENVSKAYSASIYIAIAGLIGGVIGIVAIILCFMHKDKYEKHHEEAVHPSRPPPALPKGEYVEIPEGYPQPPQPAPPPPNSQNAQNPQNSSNNSISSSLGKFASLATPENLAAVGSAVNTVGSAIGRFI